jgi:hypothetical protein
MRKPSLQTGTPSFPNGKIVFINRRPAALAIEIDKRFYAMFRAILIIGHGIVGGIQKKLCDTGLWKELFHGEEVIPKPMGIMSGSRAKQREYRQVIFGVRGSEHVKVVTKVMPFPVGIPADVAVGLAIDSAALTVADALFQAAAGTGLTLSGASIRQAFHYRKQPGYPGQ